MLTRYVKPPRQNLLSGVPERNGPPGHLSQVAVHGLLVPVRAHKDEFKLLPVLLDLVVGLDQLWGEGSARATLHVCSIVWSSCADIVVGIEGCTYIIQVEMEN